MDIVKFKQEFTEYKGLRLAREEDMLMIYNWRNSDHVRVYMHNPELIPWENHQKWFKKMLQSEQDLYFVYELKQRPVGVVCFNKIKNEKAEWGFYLGEKELPRGAGADMLRAAIKLAKNSIGLKIITATIIEQNPKSKHLHTKLGFIVRNNEYVYLVY